MSEQSRRARPQDAGVELVELRVARSAAPSVPAVEEHLGDRLAAFVDGELDHDARERVQSHLATCDACLAGAEEERRLKSRISAAAPPDPSAVFLSRLMSIAGDEDGQFPGGPGQPRRGFGSGSTATFGSGAGGIGWGGSSFGSGRFGTGALGAEHPLPGVDPRAGRRLPFHSEEPRPIAARLRSGFAPAGSSVAAASAPALSRPQQRPSAARGRRFAFAAAGAFSVAAVALGSAITGVTAAEPTVDEPYGSVTPAAETSGGAAGDYGRDSGRLAFGVPAYVPDYVGGLRSAALAPAASATAVPSGAGYQANSSALR